MHALGADAFGSLPPGAPDRVAAGRPRRDRAHRVRRAGPISTRSRCFGRSRNARAEADRLDACRPRCCRGRLRADRLISRARRSRRPASTATCGLATSWRDRDGRAWLIDPAAYGGHREVDLAMLRLFGSPSERDLRGVRGSGAARRRRTRSGSASGSSCRSWSTRCSSAARTARRRAKPRAATSDDDQNVPHGLA